MYQNPNCAVSVGVAFTHGPNVPIIVPGKQTLAVNLFIVARKNIVEPSIGPVVQILVHFLT